jgi:hypothetical protein
MVKITLDIKSCKKCPHFEERRGKYVSPDSFEAPNYDWFCLANGGEKEIQSYVEWHEEKKIPIPEWCPFIVKTQIELPKYKCSNCRDTGQYTFGGSFGGGVTTMTCPCGVINTLPEE